LLAGGFQGAVNVSAEVDHRAARNLLKGVFHQLKSIIFIINR
jgi:hypothetical protein